MLYDEVMQAVDFLRTRTDRRPSVAVILGSGLGDLVDAMEDTYAIPYTDIPNFPHSHLAGKFV